MNIAGVNYESFADGIGCRATIFISGCTQGCIGCHNSSAQNFNYGQKLTKQIFNLIINEIEKRPYVTGITLSGGDPFDKNNIYESSLLLHNLRCAFPLKDIWVYTGRSYEDIYSNDFYALVNVDILVDGKFYIDQKDTSLQFKGSKNQRIIDVQKSILEKKVVLWDSLERI